MQLQVPAKREPFCPPHREPIPEDPEESVAAEEPVAPVEIVAAEPVAESSEKPLLVIESATSTEPGTTPAPASDSQAEPSPAPQQSEEFGAGIEGDRPPT